MVMAGHHVYMGLERLMSSFIINNNYRTAGFVIKMFSVCVLFMKHSNSSG